MNAIELVDTERTLAEMVDTEMSTAEMVVTEMGHNTTVSNMSCWNAQKS